MQYFTKTTLKNENEKVKENESPEVIDTENLVEKKEIDNHSENSSDIEKCSIECEDGSQENEVNDADADADDENENENENEDDTEDIDFFKNHLVNDKSVYVISENYTTYCMRPVCYVKTEEMARKVIELIARRINKYELNKNDDNRILYEDLDEEINLICWSRIFFISYPRRLGQVRYNLIEKVDIKSKIE